MEGRLRREKGSVAWRQCRRNMPGRHWSADESNSRNGGIRIRKLPVVIIQIFQEPVVFLLFGKSGDGPDGMAEIVAESAGLCDIGLKARILACLHFQHLAFLHLSSFCNGMGSFQKECLVEEKQDQERSFNKKRDIKTRPTCMVEYFRGTI